MRQWTEIERDELEDGTVVSTVSKHGSFFETMVLGGPLDCEKHACGSRDCAMSHHITLLARAMAASGSELKKS